MISQTDLRIGNLVLDKDTNTIFEITSLNIDTLTVCEHTNPNNSGATTYDSIIGLPFSRQMLNKNKWYEKDNKLNFYFFLGYNPATTGPIEGLLDIEFPYDNSHLARVWTNSDSQKEYNQGIATIIEYWHQLQNFVYGITGKEIKDLQ